MLQISQTYGQQSLAAIPTEWKTASPRAEIAPNFLFEPNGGRNGKPALVIQHDQREGLQGWFQKSFPVQGGKFYQFQTFRKTQLVQVPRRSAMVRILWQDELGKPVPMSGPPKHGYRPDFQGVAEAEHPLDQQTDAAQWTEVSGVYQAPPLAKKAIVELHLQWAPSGSIRWSDPTLVAIEKPKSRVIRLAAVHFQPSGKSMEKNCEEFVPFIEEAAQKKADLVVLGETLTYYGTGKKYADCAEPIPGPSTKYFGTLSKKHNLYIVAGLLEKDKHLVYNVAVLLGPDGNIVGKYRKVCLPRGEIENGVAPGTEYPVFQTRFGKVGMMVCYDGFFPEVARELTTNGAEVIAWPVWGCNPALASARACENHVYLVSSTYGDIAAKWMLTAVYDHEGIPLSKAEKFGSVIVSEVDLEKRLVWNSLGDFKAHMYRHRPIHPSENEATKSMKP